jgi:hypothetical protein
MAPKYRMAAVKEAPVFHPTPEEFEDPIRYVASIRAEAEPYGLCRIVPPAGWEVPFHQDPATFSFKTRIQTVNELQLRLKKGKHRGFRAEYADFMQTQGQSVTRSPVFAGRKLDLQSLYDCVASGGGFDAACSGKRWRDIARTIVSADVGPSEAFALRQLYQKWLLAYEKHKKHQESLSPTGKAKEAAATKREREEERKREKAEAKAAAERAAAMDEETSEKEEDVLEALFELGNAADPPPKRLKLELVRAIPSARSPTFFFFSRADRRGRPCLALPPPRPPRAPPSARRTAAIAGPARRATLRPARAPRARPLELARFRPPARVRDAPPPRSTHRQPRPPRSFFFFRSPTTAQGLEEVAMQAEEEVTTAGCQNCGGTAHEESMILCDGCDLGCATPPPPARPPIAAPHSHPACPVITPGTSASVGRERPRTRAESSRARATAGSARALFRFKIFLFVARRAHAASPPLPPSSPPRSRRYHMYCLSPPIDEVPSGDWFCPDCIAAANDAEDIGFNTGKTFTMDDFEAHCKKFGDDFFGSASAHESATLRDIEEAFWKMVEEGHDAKKSVEVHYGADVDTSKEGSAFPRTWDPDFGAAPAEGVDGEGSFDAAEASARAKARDEAAKHPWNLNNLPRLGPSADSDAAPPPDIGGGFEIQIVGEGVASEGRRRGDGRRVARRFAPPRRRRPHPRRPRALAVRREHVQFLLLALRGPHAVQRQLQPQGRGEDVVRRSRRRGGGV